MMDAVFRSDREKQNFLFYKEYKNDSAILGFHSQIELYFVDDGEMEITVNGDCRLLKKGEMCFVFSFDTHRYITPESSKSSVLIIPTYLCSEFIEMFRNKRAVSPFICDKTVTRRIRQYVSELNRCGGNEIKKQGFIYVILGTVAENLSFESADGPFDTKLSAKLLMYINDNFTNDISLKTVAEKLGYNPSYISRYFKDCFKIGFNHYLTTVRLKNTLMLMNEKRYSMTYCALESGFNSLRTFHRVFADEFGCSPKEYMKNMV